MRQKIWCDRWIVKFGLIIFGTKHSHRRKAVPRSAHDLPSCAHARSRQGRSRPQEHSISHCTSAPAPLGVTSWPGRNIEGVTTLYRAWSDRRSGFFFGTMVIDAVHPSSITGAHGWWCNVSLVLQFFMCVGTWKDWSRFLMFFFEETRVGLWQLQKQWPVFFSSRQMKKRNSLDMFSWH